MSSSMMKVTVVSRKMVKPRKPTPSHLKTYKISLMDELNEPMHVLRIMYYPSSSSSLSIEAKDIINLEESLAQILPSFYPLAGRYNNKKHQVDCNDEGAEFAVAVVDCKLDQVIGVEDIDQLNDLLPIYIGAADEPTDPILAVQICRFQCGGLAIGVFASHRIFDSFSLGFFLKAWANAATNGGLVITPVFDCPVFFPSERVAPLDFGVSRVRDKSLVCKRFVFDKNSVSKLREALSAEWKSERPPSRVVVISSLLSQVLMRADKAKHGRSRTFLFCQATNVRERTIPPVSKYSIGTWVSLAALEIPANESPNMEQDYQQMVSRMRDVVVQSVKDCPRIFSDKEFGRWVMVDGYIDAAEKSYKPDYKVVWLTDWCKFGEYELDFGFGKPIWVSLADVPVQDLIILMNTKNNDGIEAWVYLHESDMKYFEQDEQLISLISNYHNNKQGFASKKLEMIFSRL